MALSIPVAWSDAHRLHAPEKAIWVGVPIDADELPERAAALRLPTVVVQEGGYVLDTVGSLVRATLEGLDEFASDL